MFPPSVQSRFFRYASSQTGVASFSEEVGAATPPWVRSSSAKKTDAHPRRPRKINIRVLPIHLCAGGIYLESMSRLDEACADLFGHVNGAVLCAAVDLDSGLVLGLHPGGGASRRIGGTLAASSARLFRGVVVGELVRALENVTEQFSEQSYLQEAQLSTSEHCFFCRTVSDESVLVVLVTNREVSVGMGWAQLKAALRSFETIAP